MPSVSPEFVGLRVSDNATNTEQESEITAYCIYELKTTLVRQNGVLPDSCGKSSRLFILSYCASARAQALNAPPSNCSPSGWCRAVWTDGYGPNDLHSDAWVDVSAAGWQLWFVRRGRPVATEACSGREFRPSDDVKSSEASKRLFADCVGRPHRRSGLQFAKRSGAHRPTRASWMTTAV